MRKEELGGNTRKVRFSIKEGSNLLGKVLCARSIEFVGKSIRQQRGGGSTRHV